ncbi:MAG: hypothetical protein ACK55Z_13085, partial [bacterium]
MAVASTNAATGGDDAITGHEGDETIIGGAGEDTIAGNEDDDLILGDSGELSYVAGDPRSIASTASKLGRGIPKMPVMGARLMAFSSPTPWRRSR